MLDDFNRFENAQIFAVHPVAQSFAGNIFGGDKRPVVRFADFKNRQDIRMIQSGSGAGFLLETLHSFCVVAEFGGQNFQRDIAFQFGIAGEIHFAHSAGADLFADFITPEFFARVHFLKVLSEVFNDATRLKV